MKRVAIFYFLILGMLIQAQDMLIPYRVGDKMGLIDGEDKIVVEPKYEEIEWLTGTYFQFTQKIHVEDSLEIEPGEFLKRNHEIPVKGLIQNGKTIIEPQPVAGYQVLPNMMINALFTGDAEKLSLNQQQFEQFKDKKPLFFLFNTEGKNLNPEGFRRLELVDTAGINSRNPQKARYALLFMENFHKEFKMCVFDAEIGGIKECLFENVSNFEVKNKNLKTKSFYLKFKDVDGNVQNKVLKITSDYFLLEEMTEAEALPETKPLQELVEENIQKNADLEVAAAQNSVSSYYQFENGVLKYKNGKAEEKEIKIKKEIQPIFKNPRNFNYSNSLIYKKGNQYGLIQNGEITEPKYDSMIYFGNNYYLVCKKMSSKLKCGTLDLNGNEIIPMQYDSIFPKMKYYQMEKDNTGKFQLVLKDEKVPMMKTNDENSYFINPLNNIVVVKDGKTGMLSLTNEEIFPVEYDEIGMNGYQTQGGKMSQFIVLKKDGQYGVVMKNYDPSTQQTLQSIIEPIFPYFPAFYFKDYYGKKDFYLFGLVDEEGEIQTYASEIGKIYSKH